MAGIPKCTGVSRLQLPRTVQYSLHKNISRDSSSLLVETLHTDGAAPRPLWRNLHGRYQAVHVVPSVTIITEQQLVIILAGATQGAGLALDALPGVLLHADHHVWGELQTCRVT